MMQLHEWQALYGTVLKVGMRLEAQTADGRWLPARLTELAGGINLGRVAWVVFLSPDYSDKPVTMAFGELRPIGGGA